MLQIDFLNEALKECKKADIHTAVDTAGNVPWEYFEKILPYTDLFLYDIRAVSEYLHIEGTGASYKLILNNLKQLSENFLGDIIVRIPVMSGFNDDLGEMQKIADFLKNIKYKSVELLPYHKMGKHKYDAIGMDCVLYDVPDEKNIEKYKKILCNA